MSKREVIAYAITHAPRGVKGGPYEGDYDEAVPTLRAAFRGERQRAKLWLPIVRSVVPTARIIRIVRKARPFKETIHVCGTCGYDAHGGRDAGGRVSPRVSLATYAGIVSSQQPSEASATLETARRRLAAVAESMTEHAYQEMASALEVDACRAGPSEASAVEVLREYVAWDCGTAADYDRIADKARRVLAGSGPDPMPVVRAAMRFAERVAKDDDDGDDRAAFVRDVDAYRKAGGK